MNISKKDLSAAIEFAGNITKGNPKGNVPSSDQLKLHVEDGMLHVVATDGSQYGWRRTKVTGSGFAPVLVSAAKLKTILSICEDKISVEPGEGKLMIKSGGGDFKLATRATTDFPAWPTEEHTEMNWTASEFADALERVSFSSNTSPTVANKWGVHVKADKQILCDAYSGIQYSRFEILQKKKPTAAEFFVPLGFLSNLAGELRNKGAKFSLSTKTAKVEHEAGGYMCALANVAFLNVQAYMDGKRTALGKMKAAEWLPFFRAAVNLGDEKLSCKVSIDGKNFHHVGPGGEEIVPLPKPLKVCELNLNAVTFSNLLEALDDSEAEISVGENRAVYVFQGSFVAVSSQLRE